MPKAFTPIQQGSTHEQRVSLYLKAQPTSDELADFCKVLAIQIEERNQHMLPQFCPDQYVKVLNALTVKFLRQGAMERTYARHSAMKAKRLKDEGQ